VTNKTEQIVKECNRQSESCLYTSTTLFIWLRYARWLNHGFIITPIIFSSLATWKILSQSSSPWVSAVFALLAGLLPAIYKALDFPTNVNSIALLAAEFKNLQDRFRQAGEALSLGDPDSFFKQFAALMKCLEDARKSSITPPEWCFKLAQKKITAGHYDFVVDFSTKALNKVPCDTARKE